MKRRSFFKLLPFSYFIKKIEKPVNYNFVFKTTISDSVVATLAARSAETIDTRMYDVLKNA